MSKKTDLKFYRSRKKEIENLSKENKGIHFFTASHNPIFIPKKKYKK